MQKDEVLSSCVKCPLFGPDNGFCRDCPMVQEPEAGDDCSGEVSSS